jgi:subtilisin family serine protease
MLENKYIILSSNRTIVPTLDNLGMRAGTGTFDSFGISGGTGTFDNEPESVVIEEATLTTAERHDLRRDPRTRAIAPPMPMKLINPKESQIVNTADVDEVTWGVRAVNAPESPFDGTDITVAVLDTGIDPDHPAFSGLELSRHNFTSEGDNDQHGHGTHCAGTIFGQPVDGKRIGIATNISRALIGKVLGEGGGSSATIAQAIQWAVGEGAHVISMSLGIDFPGFVEQLVNENGIDINPATSMALEGYRANINLFTELARFVHAQSMFGQGTIIVAASGNESKRPEYEIAVAPPAAGTDIIAVGALGQTTNGLSTASFSNNQVNISAPGVNVISAVPGGGLGSMSGTSMATPHVAGIAALWAQRQLGMTGNVDIKTLTARLIASGTFEPLVADAEAEDVGTGIVQAPSANS